MSYGFAGGDARASVGNTESFYGFSNPLNYKIFNPDYFFTKWNDAVSLNKVSYNTSVNLASNGTSVSGSNLWASGVLAPNGKIYSAPYTTNRILVSGNGVNYGITVTNASAQYRGGALANNEFIYFIPFNYSAILKVDPKTDTFKYIGNFPIANKWWGAVKAPNGKIYSAPYQNTKNMLVVDPSTDTYYEVLCPNFTVPVAKWTGGTLGPNGKIYFGSANGCDWLVIDPRDDSSRIIGGTAKIPTVGLVTAPNGKIYNVPFAGADGVYELDVETETVTKIISFSAGTYNAYDGCFGADGKIYAGQVTVAGILTIDIINKTINNSIVNTGTNNKFLTTVISGNLDIYFIPYSYGFSIYLPRDTNTTDKAVKFDNNILLSPFI